MKLTDKLLIRKAKELRKICLTNTKEHPIPIAELNMIVKRYDRFMEAAKRRKDDFAIKGLDESEKHEMPDRDVNC